MISKAQIKFIKSLQIKKFRNEHKQFIVQGKKNILELLKSNHKLEQLYVTESFFHESRLSNNNFELVSQKELEQISSFQSNNAGLAIVKIPENEYLTVNNDWILVLDQVKDPGNLGTIIRIADWYGINKIVCSEDCVDVYNPKVISASMGSFCRVKVFYTELESYLNKQSEVIFGALLEGSSVYQANKFKKGYLLMGNESQGISSNLKKFISHKVCIPRIGEAESLNVAVATGIICDNLFGKT